MRFGLYIHWPFCAAKCPYCDFNSHVAAHIDQPRWQAAYLSELDRLAQQTQGMILHSVFFGGGTPSLMHPDVVAAILDRIAQLWPQSNTTEITLEANPSSVEADRFAALAQAGVNRVSLGVQALNDADLRRLGRLHDAAEARRALSVAQQHFDRVSLDLIYARQDQTASAWRAELAEALAFGTDHLSLYQLTIEPGTVFAARHERGHLKGLPEEDHAVALWGITQEICAAAGRPAYEVSNHARPGDESRHNLIYWRCESWGGIGPGAHGRLGDGPTRRATEAIRTPGAWLAAVEAGQAPEQVTPIELAEQAEEYLMMAMRLSEGVDRARFEALGGALDQEAVAGLVAAEHLWHADGRIGATPGGRLLLNRLIAAMLA